MKITWISFGIFKKGYTGYDGDGRLIAKVYPSHMDGWIIEWNYWSRDKVNLKEDYSIYYISAKRAMKEVEERWQTTK